MSDPVRIAMLGSGFVAEFYMQGLANVNGQRVVVNFSRSADRAADFARRWGIPEHSTDLDAVIGGWDADLFVIALPNEVHFPAALALANAKRNQVCTKPLGRTRPEARKILDAARESGAMHGYAATEVFAPAVVQARENRARGHRARAVGALPGIAQRAAQPSLLGRRKDRRGRVERSRMPLHRSRALFFREGRPHRGGDGLGRQPGASRKDARRR